MLELRASSLPDLQDAPRPGCWPRAYLITFACYGARLHGDPAGTVDRSHNAPRAPYLAPNPSRVSYLKRKMEARPTRLDRRERAVILVEIQRVCTYEGWRLHAVHLRTNHVHVVIGAECKPESVMGKLKMFSSRALNEAFGRVEKRWCRHGSTRWLWEEKQVDAGIHYVLEQQGAPMATYAEPFLPAL